MSEIISTLSPNPQSFVLPDKFACGKLRRASIRVVSCARQSCNKKCKSLIQAGCQHVPSVILIKLRLKHVHFHASIHSNLGRWQLSRSLLWSVLARPAKRAAPRRVPFNLKGRKTFRFMSDDLRLTQGGGERAFADLSCLSRPSGATLGGSSADLKSDATLDCRLRE